MKKLWMLLIALALLVTALPVFASDVTFSGRMIWDAVYDSDTGASASLARFRPKLTAKIDDFNTLVTEFRMENYLVVKDTLADFWPGVRVYSAYVTTDITGALGLKLPVTIKTTLGQWEPGFTDWNYATESGWESYYATQATWSNGIADVGAFPNQFNGQVDLGFGPATLHVYSDFHGFMMFGLSGGFGPVVGWLTYQAPESAVGEGILGVEAKYSAEFGDIKLGVPVFFRYKLGAASDGALAEDYTFGVGASGDYKMFHVAAGLEGDSHKIPDNVAVDVSVKPMEPVKVYGHMYLDVGQDSLSSKVIPTNTSSFAGVDLGVSYKFGAADLMLGYVIGGDDKIAIPINGDTFNVANGLYFAVDVSY